MTRLWTEEARAMVKDPRSLKNEIAGMSTQTLDEISARFPVKIPPHFLRLTQTAKGRKALLRQVLPDPEELTPSADFKDDPLEERRFFREKAVLRKYAHRALVILSTSCAGHCRYCFRRNFPYRENALSRPELKRLARILGADPSIREVILSGGDPLMVKDDKLDIFLQGLEEFPRIERIRFHTRMLSFIPSRIDTSFLRILDIDKFIVFVTHFNHGDEISPQAKKAVELLKKKNVVMLNQAVLLRGVNNDVETLKNLSEKLFACGIMPYYLHQLDRTTGTAHFEIPVAEGKALVKALQMELPGYLVPRYVREIPGAASKTPLL